MTVPAAHNWGTNAALISDVAQLGYLGPEMLTLDATFGRGRFWTAWRPRRLVGVDCRVTDKVRPATVADNRNLPFPDGTFDAVVYDPDYKLSGTPALGDFDDRYGVHAPKRWQDRLEDQRLGFLECARVLAPGGVLLFKCQDQVCSGAIRWVTDLASTVWAPAAGLTKTDRFDFLGGGRVQPMEGRTQRHAHGRPSTLLVFHA